MEGYRVIVCGEEGRGELRRGEREEVEGDEEKLVQRAEGEEDFLHRTLAPYPPPYDRLSNGHA